MPAQAAQSVATESLDSVPNWRHALAVGSQVGNASAPVTIVEFADLECPACRGFEKTLNDIRQTYADSVSVVYVSYPLSMHRFALPAARAQECAESRGALEEWRTAVYDNQDSLGLKSWGSFAHDAGIEDTAAVALCAKAPAISARLDSAIAFGHQVGLLGTPTILVNGWRFASPPSEEQFRTVISALLKDGHPPTKMIASRG